MGCGCKDRQKMIAAGARAAAQGQVRQVAQQARNVTTSIAQDLRRVANAGKSQYAKMVAAGRRR